MAIYRKEHYYTVLHSTTQYLYTALHSTTQYYTVPLHSTTQYYTVPLHGTSTQYLYVVPLRSTVILLGHCSVGANSYACKKLLIATTCVAISVVPLAICKQLRIWGGGLELDLLATYCWTDCHYQSAGLHPSKLAHKNHIAIT